MTGLGRGSRASAVGGGDDTVEELLHGVGQQSRVGGDGAGHGAIEGLAEALHFGLGTDGYADMSGPNGPDAADENVLRGHGGDHFLGGALSV